MNPTDSAQFMQNWMNAYKAGVQQPVAQLQQTQAETGAARASAAAASEAAQNTALQIQQKQLFNTYGQQMQKAADPKTGIVPPQVYNAIKNQAVGAGVGITADQFDSQFEHAYADPTSIDYNTSTGFANRNAQGEIKRQIQAQLDQFNQVPDWQKGPAKSFFEQLGPAGQYFAPEATAYENSTQGLAAQLKGLVAGTGLRVTQAELDRWASLLPSPRNSDAVNNKNLQILDAQLKATFNTPEGLDPKYLPQTEATTSQPQAVSTGSDVLNNLLSQVNNPTVKTAISDVANRGVGAAQTGIGLAENTVNPLAQIAADDPTGTLDKIFKSANLVPQQNANDIIGNILRGTVESASKDTGIGQNGKLIDLNEAKQNLEQHPANVAMDALTAAVPFLKGAIPEGEAPPETPTEETPSSGQTNIPGKASFVQKYLTPGKSKASIGNIRDTLLNTADKTGAVISGDEYSANFDKWAEQAKLANPQDADAIDATAESIKKQYGGKTFKPSELKSIYDKVQNAYTKNGTMRTSTQSFIDDGVKQTLSDTIDAKAPGFKQTSDLFDQIYKAEKSPVGKIARNIPQAAARTAMNVAGLGILREFLGM